MQKSPRGRWFYINAIGVLVAACSACSALLLKLAMKIFHVVFFDILLDLISFSVGGFNVAYLILPVIGALIVSPILTRWAESAKGGGVGALMESFTYKRADVPARVWPLRLFGAAVTIGSGGSGGPEGPVIQAGGTVGALFGSLLHFTPNEKRILIACGASAGISAFFDAPLGGSILIMELLIPSFEFFITIPIMIAGVVGGIIGGLVIEPGFALATISYPATYSIAEYGIFILFGSIIGLLGFCWIKFFLLAQKGLDRLKLHPALLPIIGAALTGLIIMFVPGMGIEADGEAGIEHVITSGFLGVSLCLLGLLKMLATTATVGSGGSGGLLAPGLYMGCMFGGGVASLLDLLFPGNIQSIDIFFVLGMGTFFSAASQEPIGIMILIIELADNAGLILPLMTTTIVSFSLVWLLSRGQLIYTTRQEIKRMPIRTDTITMYLNTSVSGYIVRDVEPFRPEQRVSEIRESFARQSLPAVPVLQHGKAIGVITAGDLAKVAPEASPVTTVAAVMTINFPSIMSFTKIQDALDRMVELGTDWLVLLHPGDQHAYFGLFVHEQFMHKMRMADFI